jgi:hypothetical protein
VHPGYADAGCNCFSKVIKHPLSKKKSYLDVQSVNVGKASEEAGQHLDLPEDNEIHSHRQYPDAWNRSGCTRHCVKLQCSPPRQAEIINHQVFYYHREYHDGWINVPGNL